MHTHTHTQLIVHTIERVCVCLSIAYHRKCTRSTFQASLDATKQTNHTHTHTYFLRYDLPSELGHQHCDVVVYLWMPEDGQPSIYQRGVFVCAHAINWRAMANCVSVASRRWARRGRVIIGDTNPCSIAKNVCVCVCMR